MKGGWFITGTDTGVGKTFVSQAMLRSLTRRGLRAVGMKPVATGSVRTERGFRSDDAEQLIAAGSVTAAYEDVNPYAFEPPIAPHIAAAQVGMKIQIETLRRHFDRLAQQADWIVVEGAGGWLVPIDRNRTLSDLARDLSLPVVLVVGVRLGCINHALLSARAICADGLVLSGWVANSTDATFDTAQESIIALTDRLDAPCLANIPFTTDRDGQKYGEEIMRHLQPNYAAELRAIPD